MANPIVLGYKQNPGAGPITIAAPGLNETTVLLRYASTSAGVVYWTVAYSEGSAPTSTAVTLKDATAWWIQVSLPDGVSTSMAAIQTIFPITKAAVKGGVQPDDGDPPPPGTVKGGHGS